AEVRAAGLFLLEIRDRVMRDLASLDRRRTDLDGADPARLRDAGRRHTLVPRVLGDGGHRERARLDDHARLFLAELLRGVPALILGPGARGGHVLRIALRRAGIDPFEDGVDLRVAQRAVVLELRHADGRIDVPRRHGVLGHLRADGADPRTRLRVRL